MKYFFISHLLLFSTTSFAGPPLLPDLQTVVPTHLQLVNEQQREILRFSNGIANTGAGPLQLRPLFAPPITIGMQELLDSDGNIISSFPASFYEFHEEHNHWHLDAVAFYELRAGSPYGLAAGSNATKITFCLIDWYQLDDYNNGVNGTTYFDCESGLQGISAGWVDQYHHATEGQQVDLTGIPAGLYYLVSTANPDFVYQESDYFNNTAWVGFNLIRSNPGNPQIKITDNSPCSTPSLCGGVRANR